MSSGKAVFKSEGNPDLNLGSVTSISESFSKSVSTVPLMSLPMENAVSVETGSGINYVMKFTRVDPGDDGGRSNRDWYDIWTNALNRWQLRTDGFLFQYLPKMTQSDDGNPYLPEITYNGYVKKLSRVYSAGNPTMITGNIDFHVGTMFSGSDSDDVYDPDKDHRVNDFSISLSGSDGDNLQYILMSNAANVNCVRSYHLIGGINSPFEALTINISSEKLSLMYPDLINDLYPGKNTILIDAVGLSSKMTVVKVKLKKNIITLTAYCNAEVIKSRVLSNEGVRTPAGWIKEILTGAEYGDGIHGLFDSGQIISNIDLTPSNNTGGDLRFPEGTNVWYILQICTMILSARVFFAGSYAYVVDCTEAIGEDLQNISWNASIDLYPMSKTDDPYGLYASVIGESVLGDEGMDAMINALPVRCQILQDDGTYKDQEKVFKDAASIETYQQEQTGESIDMSGLSETAAQLFADNFFKYRREPQVSVKFSVKEMRKVKESADSSRPIHVWTSSFTTITGAKRIIDNTENFALSNKSKISNTPANAKLLMTSYERQYPEGATEYSFGVIANVDLANSTSKIVSAQKAYLK